MGENPTINQQRQALVRSGVGKEKLNGMVEIPFPVKGVFLEFDIHVFNADVSIFFYIDDMKRISVYFNNVANRIYQPKPGRSATMTRIQKLSISDIKYGEHMSFYHL